MRFGFPEIVVRVVGFCFMVVLSGLAWAESGGAPAMDLAALTSDDPAIQETALAALGEAADPKTLPILTALYEGSLHRWTESSGQGRIVILILKTEERPDGETRSYLADAATGENIKEWDESAAGPEERLERISVGSFEGRRRLQAALIRTRLFNPAPDIRNAAATKIGNTGDPSTLPLLGRALERETDRWVRHAIEEAVQQIRLEDPDASVRAAAARRLGEIKGLQAFPRMKSLLTEEPREPDEAARRALQAAVDEIKAYQERQEFVGILFSGVSLGSILLMMGLGLAVTFGLMGVINMAHGEMMMIGAYTAFVMQGFFTAHVPAPWHDGYFLAALPLSFVIAGLVGVVLEKTVIRFLYGRPLETLLATWGVSLMLQQTARLYFGDLTSVNSPGWARGGLQVMVGLVLPFNRIFIVGLSLAVLGVIYWILFRTRSGLRIRAVMQNRDMSACLGISTRKVDSWTFALGAGLAGLAGCALSLIGNVDPEMGKTYIVDSFMVVVVGGVGKLAGTVVSAMGIGMLNKFLEPVIGGTGGAIYAKLLILAAIILFLQRKPSGLFPAKGRAAGAS